MFETTLPKFNKSIHGLRGFSALIILTHHLYLFLYLKFLPPLPSFLHKFFVSLNHGVDLFFLISGYLITASLIRHHNVGNFVIDRIIRIYPAFLILQLIYFIFLYYFIKENFSLVAVPWLHYGATVSDHSWFFNFLSNMFFLPGVFNLPLFQGYAWSLSYEAFFYIAAAFLYLMHRRRLAFWAIFVVLLIMIFLYHPRSLFFLSGAVAYIYLRNMTAIKTVRIPCLDLLLLIIFISLLHIGMKYHSLAFYILSAVCGTVFFNEIRKGEGWLGMLLKAKPLQFFGTISYSLYLWHSMFILVLPKLLSPGISTSADFSIILIYTIVATMLTSVASYNLLELKAAKFLKERLGRKN